ncbi:MAG: hypothetical protein STSR0004_21070 [Peptococcaceae bacterium]
MFSRLKEERGQALVLTTLIVMLLAVIGTGLVSVGARQKSFSATEVRLENAYFAANAGLTRALTTLEKANKHESVVEIIYLFDPSRPEYAIWTNFAGQYGKGKIESVTPSLYACEKGDYNGDGDGNDYKRTYTIESVGRYPKESIFYAAKTLSGKVYVYKLGGGGSWINLPPAIPLGLSAEPGNQQITLSWLANIEKDLGGYKIYRSESLEGTYTLIHTAGKVTSWVDTGLTNGTTYYYKISAYSLVGLESEQSLPAWATPFNPAPAAPTGLTATAGNQKVTLQWNANSEEDLAGYKIYRSLTEGGTYTLIHTAGKVTSWVDTGLTNGTTYYYKISAYDADGNESEQSLPAWATPFNPFDMAVFALSPGVKSIDMGGRGSARITGNAGTNTTAAGGVNFPWSAIITGNLSIGPGGNPSTVITHPSGSTNVLGTINNLTAVRSYPMPPFPAFPSDLPVPPINGPVTDVGGGKRKLTVGNWPYQNVTIDSDACYDEIEINSNYTLTIDVGSGERKIRVRDLDIQQGHIVLTGTGTLTLYVDQSFNLHGTINNGGSSNRVSIYYNGSTEVTSGGSNTINGIFFANTANITITNGTGITGCILTSGSMVTVSGDASATIKVLYAPNATVTVSNSGKIRGAVIANKYTSSGSGLVTYDPAAGSTYPF